MSRRDAFDMRAFQTAELRSELQEEKRQVQPRLAPVRGGGARPVPARTARPPAQRGPPRREGLQPNPEPGAGHYAGISPAQQAADWHRHAEDPSDVPRRPGAPGQRTDLGVGLDVHELLKQEAFGASQGACDDHFEKNRPCPAGVYGVSDQYVTLDSWLKVESSRPDLGRFQWNFNVQGDSVDQALGVRDRMDTVVEIQVSAFIFPVLREVGYALEPEPADSPSGRNVLVLVRNNANVGPPGGPPILVQGPGTAGQYPNSVLPFGEQFITPWVANPYTQLPFGGRFTVQLLEAGLQSYSDRNGARHHYEFAVSHQALAANPTMLLASPLSGSLWDNFLFTDPLKDVHGLTLVFRNPDVPLRFDPDVYYGAVIALDGAAAPGPYLRFDIPDHGLLCGDRIFVSGFQSGAEVLDRYVNRAEGHVINGDPTGPAGAPSTPVATPDAFWLDPSPSVVDLTPAFPPGFSRRANVFIAKRRIRIKARLRRVVGRLTNYLAP